MGVIIIREMVGSSPESWSVAAVVRHSARVEDGRIVDYEVQLKIHFEYEGA